MQREPVQIVLASNTSERTPAIARWITSGRGSLKFILGDEDCRHRLLADGINWDRVLLAYRSDGAVGYATFKHHRRGPFSPGLRPFVREFGRLGGTLRYGLFMISECREWYYGFYLYGLRVHKVDRRQGVASALLQAVCAQALDSNHEKVELEVQAKNLAARAFYAHHGFVSIRTMSWLSRLMPIPTVINLRRLLSPRP
ncbi:GNAT family N-acetyltransferase [Pseudomonas umsongensis]|jgi:ribosomal protein S18 acetylase RimI-like enzyme|uniref:GNAT family N-acetyltransferase n=1 Tax=Pseudomonas umsongensis TaxID=198618 RepID=UPI00200A92CE|nr:GNAT family N-acetyltransferase [Pseudomonas umsongensis]MCK8654863.1 GNAT family N-acetyltransferase [Pseudomonas umsongensis]